MKKISIYCLIALLLSVFACDRLDNDQLPDDTLPVLTEDDLVYAQPGSPVLIDLLANDAILTNATFEIVENPAFGSINLLKDGQCFYRSIPNTTAPKDQFRYRVTTGNAVSEGVVEIMLNVDSAAIPCEFMNVQSDFVHITDVNELDNTISVDVLSNDAFCEGQWDMNSLAVVLNPFMGNAYVDSGWIAYDAHSGFIDPTVPYLDFLIYSVDRIDENETGYGLVVFEYLPTTDSLPDTTVCATVLPEAINDQKEDIKVGEEICIDVLANDIYCPEDMDWASLKITAPPIMGTASLQMADSGKVYYTADSSFMGNDCLTYEFCTISGDCYSAVVHLYGDSVGDCTNARANNDYYYIDSLTAGYQYCANVVINDIYCLDQLDSSSLSIVTPPTTGGATINPYGTLCYFPDSSYTGIDSVSYQFCLLNRGGCYSATLYIID